MIDWSSNTSAAAPCPAERVAVNTPSKAALLAEIEVRLSAGKGFTVATLNLDHVVKLRRNPVFRTAYSRHSHVVADGNPIVWLSKLAGHATTLVPGSELVGPAAQIAARVGAPVALIGSTDAALARTAEVLERRYPGLHVAVRLAPPMGFDPEGQLADELIEAIAASGARLCFLALGAPRQEILAIRAHQRLPETGFLSIGAGLDFVAGTQIRAPVWVRTVAAEWIWRLATNPRRLGRRYAACIAILPGLLGTALQARRRRET